jgi:hypothetical protein
MTTHRNILFIICPLVLLIVTGCSKKEITRYTVKKEQKPEQAMSDMSAPPTGTAPIKYETPEGWSDIGGSGMRVAAFEVEDVSITVIPLPGAAGTLLGNINRWRGQVGLDPTTEEALETTDIQIAEHPANVVELVGPEQAMTAAILKYHGQQWFFKMMGPSAAVAGQRAAFDAFLNSITFPNHSDH